MRKKLLFLMVIYFPVFFFPKYEISAQDSLAFSFSFNYQEDLSDTFGGGALLSGDFVLYKSWYGLGINYGNFQSHSSISYKVVIDDINQSFSIPIDELSIMKLGSFSGLIAPIRAKRFQFDILAGFVYGRSKNMSFKSLTYTYNYNEKKLKAVEKDYQLIERTHFGYQIGVNASLYFLKKVGIQMDTRFIGLNNGGSFLFLGVGLCFQI